MIVAPERLTPGIIEMHWNRPTPSACRAGSYDTRTFAPNREVTVTGRIEGFDAAEGPSNRASNAAPPVPRVAAQAIVLWPRRR